MNESLAKESVIIISILRARRF